MMNQQEFDEFYNVDDVELENNNDEFISSTEMLKLLADSLRKYNKVSSENLINSKFEKLSVEDYENLSIEEKFEYFDYLKETIKEGDEDIVYDDVNDLDRFLEESGALKIEDAFRKISEKEK